MIYTRYFNWLQLKLNDHQNTYNYSLSAIDYNNYIEIFRDKRELKTPKITVVISSKQTFFYRNGYCPTNGTPIHMVIIASCPKHIQFGEERIQFFFSNIYKKIAYENGHTYHMLCLVLQCCEALQQDIFCSKASFW